MTGGLGLPKWTVVVVLSVVVAIFLLATYLRLPAVLAVPPAYGLLFLAFAVIASISFGFALRSIAQRERELAGIQKVTQAVSASLDLVEMLSRALDSILELTHAAAGRAWLVDADSGTLRNMVHRGLFPDVFAEPTTLQPGDNLPGRVARSGRAESVSVPSQLANGRQLLDKGFVEFASVPLVARDRVVGVIDIAARHRGELGISTRNLLTSLGRGIGLAIENACLFEAARARQADAENLYQAGMDLSSKLDLGQVLHAVTERGRTLLNVDASALCLWDSQNRWLIVGSQSGPADAFESQGRIGQRVAQRIGMLRVDATHRDDCITCMLVRTPYCQAHIEMPLRLRDQVIGCLCVSSSHSRTFGEREIQVLGGLADQAAIAIQNARAYDRASNVATSIERERLAREMHDTLAQVLGFVNTKSQAVRELLDAGQIDAARGQIDQITQMSQELYADVREVILGLRAATSPEKSLFPTLADYVQNFAKQSAIDAQLIIEEGAQDLSFAPAVELQLIRIVQESLTNIRKHAHAQHAIVCFSTVDGHAEMRVEDDGCGFDPSRIARGDWPQFGLQTMRERAESVGGAFVIVSKPNTGTHIVVQIPFGYASHKLSPTQDSRAEKVTPASESMGGRR